MYDNRSAKVPDCAMAPPRLRKRAALPRLLAHCDVRIMNMAVSSCIPFSSTNRSKHEKIVVTNHESWIHDTSDKCTFPILSCYMSVSWKMQTAAARTTFTYINIVHKTRNSNLHPRTSWQTTSQYYFPVHTTWHYTACTQYYFALQNLQKLLPSTTLYYKTCTKYSPVLLCTTKLAQSRSQYATICCSKTGCRRQSRRKTILNHFFKGILKGNLLAPNLRKFADKSLSQPWCSHSNTIYDLQLQKTIILRMQPLHQATLTQPLQCDLQRLSCKTQ